MRTVQESNPLAAILAPVRERLLDVDRRLQQHLQAPDPFLRDLAAHALRFSGKRMRPALVLLAADACGGAREEHVDYATLVELIHTATLVHDDVLDEALIRRRTPTLNAAWGNEAAILYGDYLFSTMFCLAVELPDPRALRLVARATRDICAGEVAQVGRKGRFDVAEAEYLRIIELKTASLFSAACELGSLGTPTGDRYREPLRAFGTALGRAFQIVDDCLDLVGREAEMGKSLGTDLAKGKATLPVLRLLRALPAERREPLAKLLASPDGVADKRDRLLPLLDEHTIIPEVLAFARGQLRDSLRELEPLAAWAHWDRFQELAEYVVGRRV